MRAGFAHPQIEQIRAPGAANDAPAATRHATGPTCARKLKPAPARARRAAVAISTPAPMLQAQIRHQRSAELVEGAGPRSSRPLAHRSPIAFDTPRLAESPPPNEAGWSVAAANAAAHSPAGGAMAPSADGASESAPSARSSLVLGNGPLVQDQNQHIAALSSDSSSNHPAFPANIAEIRHAITGRFRRPRDRSIENEIRWHSAVPAHATSPPGRNRCGRLWPGIVRALSESSKRCGYKRSLAAAACWAMNDAIRNLSCNLTSFCRQRRSLHRPTASKAPYQRFAAIVFERFASNDALARLS